MRRAALLGSTAVLLVGPTVLAFFSGGYFDGPRAVAGAVAWAIVLLLALVGSLPVPTGAAGRVALAGLVGLAAWSAASMAWTPLLGPALDNVQRLILYIGVLLAATALLRDRTASRAVEPVLALGALVAIAYGLSERLLPALVDLGSMRSFGAGSRLEQPLTYWNAEGLLAAMGLVLCVRLAGDPVRPVVMRMAAAAACAPLGLGVYLSYSRGAVMAVVLGLTVLVAAAPTWTQLRAIAAGLGAGAVASACASLRDGVALLVGSQSQQQRHGAIMLVLLMAVGLGAALSCARAVRAERRASMRLGTLPLASKLPAAAAVVAALCVLGLAVGSSGDRAGGESAAGTPARFASVNSVRYEYWRVGLQAFADEPVLGVGSGGFRVAWRLDRRVNLGVTEVHSLPLEVASELGLPGILFLGTFIAGVALAGRTAIRNRSPLAPGACATLAAWLLHASIDWDWQLPA
ncbi:MAG TPA: O-antigen ligase family protein, partial [Thermoleophilaceae bacterium]|nr:O-antigen ligase family protein [Thermoleophilaceae bacterium]